jgi:putative hydroxymethylpyrimidine transport system substrate-binding protein
VIDVTLPLFRAPGGKPFGWQAPRDWRAFEAWMRREGIVRAPPREAPAFTNDLLPGQGL